MERHLGTHHEDRHTPDDISVDEKIESGDLMSDVEINSAMTQVQMILTTILAAPYRRLLTTFESAEALRKLAENSLDWSWTLSRIKRNHAIVMILAVAQEDLKQAMTEHKLGESKSTVNRTSERSDQSSS
jgi:hypothetical protein